MAARLIMRTGLGWTRHSTPGPGRTTSMLPVPEVLELAGYLVVSPLSGGCAPQARALRQCPRHAGGPEDSGDGASRPQAAPRCPRSRLRLARCGAQWQAPRALPSPAAYTAACGARGARSRRVRSPSHEREVTSAHRSAKDSEDGAGVSGPGPPARQGTTHRDRRTQRPSRSSGVADVVESRDGQ
jgi:hypothetical protein